MSILERQHGLDFVETRLLRKEETEARRWKERRTLWSSVSGKKL